MLTCAGLEGTTYRAPQKQKESAFGALLFCPIGGPVGAAAGYNLQGGFPPGPGRGIQAFSRESPDAKSRGGIPPAPPGFRGRSFPLARFGGCAALFRSIGYYEPHVRALIWELSFIKNAF